MAQRPKAKRKQKSLKNTDKKQSERFIEAARKLDISDSKERFENVFKRIVTKQAR